MPQGLCANFDTDPTVSGCETPYDGVGTMYMRSLGYTPTPLCRTCFARQCAKEREVQTGTCHTCQQPLFGGDSHPQCSGFPLD